MSSRTEQLRRPDAMSDEYPYSELEVFVAGYERGRSFLRPRPASSDRAFLVTEELASRRLTMYDLSREGLMMLGMQAEFVPRELFDAGVRRAIDQTTAPDETT